MECAPPPNGEFAPAGIDIPAGIGDFSERDIARVLENGKTPDGDSVGGAMTKVVRDTSQLSDADRNAIAVYIKSLPPIEGQKPPDSGT